MGSRSIIARTKEERNVRYLLAVALLAGLAAAAPLSAEPCGQCQTCGGCQGSNGHCQRNCQPEPEAPCDCPCPCDHRSHNTLFGPEHAAELISHLSGCADCCERLKAVKKLGHRLHADFCSNPCVLPALIDVVLFDKCWEVREAAVWAIYGQGAYTPEGLTAVYVSSKLDPHYGVRDAAIQVLDRLTLCHSCCYKDLYASADDFIAELRELKYKATADHARELYNAAIHNWQAKRATSSGSCAAAGAPRSSVTSVPARLPQVTTLPVAPVTASPPTVSAPSAH
jgi:hypothetical protein